MSQQEPSEVTRQAKRDLQTELAYRGIAAAVGLGACVDGEFQITVTVPTETAGIPDEFAGHKVVVRVSGAIRPQ